MAYITVAEVRAAGLTDPPSDADVTAAINLWQTFIDRATRQWFDAKAADFYFDGNDSDTMHFRVPIISVSALYVNDETVVLDPSKYRVYKNLSGPEDDRRNPRVKLVSGQTAGIFSGPILIGDRRLRFRKGRQNCRIVGTFGFVESDGVSPPPLIKRALTKLVIEKLLNPQVPDPSLPDPPPLLAGVVKREKTDDHEIEYDVSTPTATAAGLSGITSDPEILTILKLFKGPLLGATPAHFSDS